MALGDKKTLKIALVGTPNVGKSVFFHQIAGADVIVSNYPGTTVEIHEAKVKRNDFEISLFDLPGIYSLGALSEDEIVARKAILEQRPDVVIDILDASNLERSLYLTLQLLELNIPLVIALNMVDLAESQGLHPNPDKLSKILGSPVIPTVATRGKNISKVFDVAITIAQKSTKPEWKPKLSGDLEGAVGKLSRVIKRKFREIPYNLPPETIALRILEGDAHIIETIAEIEGSEDVLEEAERLVKKIENIRKEPLAITIARERHSLAAMIAKNVTEIKKPRKSKLERLDSILTSPKTGLPIAAIVFVLMLLTLIYFGGLIEDILTNGWENHISPSLTSAFSHMGKLGEALNIGLNWGIQGILAVIIPYILPFFIIMGILEDVGYLPRIAFLLDSLMHKIGLHGRAVIPLFGGFGCNVPAIMATRTLLSKRERVIASILITMIPCSARTAVILGLVGNYLGVLYALTIYAIILFLIFLVGFLLNRWIPGKTPGMIMEVPPLRAPAWKPILANTWIRMKHFLFLAMPLLLVSSFIIGLMQVGGILDAIVPVFSPLTTGLLGLPAITIIPLLYGFLRKEGGLVLLMTVAGTSNLLEFMTPLQLYVYVLVLSIYIPCVATVAVIRRELGWKIALSTAFGTFMLAVAVGGLVFHFNPLRL
ncbi:MAG: ferrous iron transport protein B [Candidatus Hadarchaeales archaeon]